MRTISLARVYSPDRSLIDAAREWRRVAGLRARESDDDFAFPDSEVAALHRAGLLLAPFPRECGGENIASGDLAVKMLVPILRLVGSGDLSLGRLYEGHVNAAALLTRFGRPDQISAVGRLAAAGGLLGVWNTDDSERLRLVESGSGWRLRGRKILCSGAGFIERPLVTATDGAGRVLMVMPRLARGERADLSSWTPQGMRASATGAVDFNDVEIHADQIIGADGDYRRQPTFSGGAWRFAAVQLGGMERLLDLLREHFAATKRGGDPHQSARLGTCVIAVETARLWVERAARLAETSAADAESIVAYVNFARTAVERAALDLLELVHRSVGLASFMRPNAIERISRDLSTYLRQPGPDRALTDAAAWALVQVADADEMWT